MATEQSLSSRMPCLFYKRKLQAVVDLNGGKISPESPGGSRESEKTVRWSSGPARIHQFP